MGWSEEVYYNSKSLGRGKKALQAHVLKDAKPVKPNTETLRPFIATVAIVSLTKWWQREGRKLNGRNIPFIGAVQKFFSGGNRPATRNNNNGAQWKGQSARTMAGAAAVARSQGANRTAPTTGGNRGGKGGGKKKKKGGNKKR